MLSSAIIPEARKWLNASIIFVLSFTIALPILGVLSAWFTPELNIWSYFAETLLTSLLFNTVIVLVGVGLGVVVVGTALAWLVVMVEFPLRRYLEWAMFLPFAVPAYVLAFIYLEVFNFSGYFQTWLRAYLPYDGVDIRTTPFAMIAVFVMAFYPYVYLMARASFKRQQANIIASAQLLGASMSQLFFKIAVPLARPAIIAGLTVTLMETLADFGVVSLFNYDTFTTAIYSAWQDFRSVEAAAQLSSLLVIIAFLLISLEKFSRGRARYHSTELVQHLRYRPHIALAWLITLGFVGVLLVSFVLPMLQLVIWVWHAYHDRVISDLAHYGQLVVNSGILTLSAVCIIIVIAMLIVLPNTHLKRGVIVQTNIRIATLGYALPGSVLAVALLYMVDMLSRINMSFGGESFNHIIFGSIALLMLAYVTRFLAIAYYALDASSQQIKPVFSEVAQLLGAKRLRIIWRVYLPMIRPSLFAACLLVAVDVMKELPATYLLRPFGWETLAISIYEKSVEGLHQEAALPALFIVLLSLLFIFILAKIDRRFR